MHAIFIKTLLNVSCNKVQFRGSEYDHCACIESISLRQYIQRKNKVQAYIGRSAVDVAGI